MDITQALAEVLRAERAISRVRLPDLADAAGISRASVMRKLQGEREITMSELRGFATALGTSAAALMAAAESRVTPLMDDIIPPEHLIDVAKSEAARIIEADRVDSPGDTPSRARSAG